MEQFKTYVSGENSSSCEVTTFISFQWQKVKEKQPSCSI